MEFFETKTMNQNIGINEVNIANSLWLSAELDPQEMEIVTGGALLRRKALNRWLFQFQQNKLNTTTVKTNVTAMLTDTTNRQANLDLSSQFYSQLAAIQGDTQLGSSLYRAIGLPIPS
jgi:hypothetical protein